MATWTRTTILLCVLAAGCEKRITAPPRASSHKALEEEMSQAPSGPSAPVMPGSSSGPRFAAFDGKGWRQKANLAGLDEGDCAHETLGQAHRYRFGSAELEIEVYPMASREDADNQYVALLGEERGKGKMAMNMKKVSKYDISEEHRHGDKSFLSKKILADMPFCVVSVCAKKGSFVMKVIRSHDGASDDVLKSAEDKARQQIEYLLERLR